MAISDLQAAQIRRFFSEGDLLTQAAEGNLSSEDLAFIMSMPESDDFISASELTELIAAVANNTAASVVQEIDGLESSMTAFTDDLWDRQFEDVYDLLEGQSSILDELGARIDRQIQEVNFNASEAFSGYENDLFNELTFAIASTQTALDQTEESISSQISGILESIKDVVIDESTDVIDALSDPLELIQTTTQTVVDKTTSITSALAEAVPEMGQIVAGAVEGVGTAVTAGFGAAFDGIIDSLGLNQLLNFMQLLGGGMNQASDSLDGFSDLNVREGSWDVPASEADVANMWLMSAPFLGTRLGLQYPNEVERLRQIAYEHSRPQLLDVASTLEYIKRNPRSEDLVIHNLTRAGYDSNKITQLKSLITQPLGLIENTVALRRKFITPETYEEKLRILGLAPDDIELAEKLSMQLPPIGDLIRMVVRDTFEPDVVESGQLSEGFEQFPLETAEELGINNYWAEKYWQAHWELPSLQQGFEMLHRDKIDEQDLLALFKAADLAPGYWEPMQAISYRPYTRVDVRRMHALGVLDESQVLRSYLDLGYDQEKAANLTAFTLAYNDSTKKVEKAKNRDLTKSDIIGMYNDGVLEKDQTFNYLMDIGYSDSEATVLIEREDIQADIKERKADIENVINQAKIKAITYEDAQDRLASLDLTRTETNRALASLSRASQTRTRTPSKTDLDNWLALNLITSGDYAEELRTLGYADRYVDLYVEETTAETESDILSEEVKASQRREPRNVSKGNLESLFQALIISPDDYIAGLQLLGYREADIDNLLTLQQMKLDEREIEERERLARGEEAAIKERLPSRSLLGKLFLKGLIPIDSYRDGLTLLGFNPENIELLSKLITAKGEEIADKQARADSEAG